jgi:hypothetical protein
LGRAVDGGVLDVRLGGASGDDSDVLCGCLETARRIKGSSALPTGLNVKDRRAITLRGTCHGMQKTSILLGRKVYEYPYTPGLFPFFYDKEQWRAYHDFFVEDRMNTLQLRNGHPLAACLIRLR